MDNKGKCRKRWRGKCAESSLVRDISYYCCRSNMWQHTTTIVGEDRGSGVDGSQREPKRTSAVESWRGGWPILGVGRKIFVVIMSHRCFGWEKLLHLLCEFLHGDGRIHKENSTNKRWDLRNIKINTRRLKRTWPQINAPNIRAIYKRDW